MTRTVEDCKGDAGVNARVCGNMGIKMVVWNATGELMIDEGEVVVDALLGTGVDRAVSGAVAECVAWINAARARVVAVDVPTGMDCDTGEACEGGSAVRAEVTVTLAGMKVGLLKECAKEYAGEVFVGDIGAPERVLRELGEGMPI
jgi:NAD(P)H-hydrate epimerase